MRLFKSREGINKYPWRFEGYSLPYDQAESLIEWLGQTMKEEDYLVTCLSLSSHYSWRDDIGFILHLKRHEDVTLLRLFHDINDDTDTDNVSMSMI